MPNKLKNGTKVPDYAIDAVARALLPLIQTYHSTQSEEQREKEERHTEKE